MIENHERWASFASDYAQHAIFRWHVFGSPLAAEFGPRFLRPTTVPGSIGFNHLMKDVIPRAKLLE